MAAHPAGAVIALSAGTHETSTELAGDFDIIGACAPATLLKNRPGAGQLITVLSGRLRVANLRVESDDPVGVAASDETTALVIEGAAFTGGSGAIDSGADDTTLTDVIVQDADRGIRVFGTANVVFNRVNVKRVGAEGMLFAGTITATVANSYVADVGSDRGTAGFGLWARDNTRLRLDASMFEGVRRNDIAIWDGASIVARDIVIRGRPATPGDNGVDIAGGSGTFENLYIAGKGGSAIWVFNDSALSVRDVVVHDTGPCAAVNEGSTFDVTRLDCRRVHTLGVFLKRCARSDLSHVNIEDVRVDREGALGEGVLIEHHRSTGDHIAINGATNYGFTLRGNEAAPAHAAYSHLTVRGTKDREAGGGNAGTLGVGVGVRSNTSVALDHVLLEANNGPGLENKTTDTPNTYDDITIRGSRFGGGAVFLDGRSTITRLVLEDNSGTALDLNGAVVDANHVTIRRSELGAVALLGRAAEFSNFLEADLTLRRFVIDDQPIGVVIGRYATFSLADGEIRSTDVAIDIKQTGFDLEKIAPTVHFRANKANVQVD